MESLKLPSRSKGRLRKVLSMVLPTYTRTASVFFSSRSTRMSTSRWNTLVRRPRCRGGRPCAGVGRRKASTRQAWSLCRRQPRVHRGHHGLQEHGSLPGGSGDLAVEALALGMRLGVSTALWGTP